MENINHACFYCCFKSFHFVQVIIVTLLNDGHQFELSKGAIPLPHDT